MVVIPWGKVINLVSEFFLGCFSRCRVVMGSVLRVG